MIKIPTKSERIEIYRSNLSKRDLKHSGTFFPKIYMRPWIRSLSNSLRSAHTRRPAYMFRRSSIRYQTRDAPMSSLRGVDPWDPRAPQGPPHKTPPQGTQGAGPKGAFGALWGMGPWGPLGLFRSHSAWKAISNGGFFRNQGRGRPWVRNRARN